MYRDLQQTKAELRASRDEVQKYRGEMGYLDISDPSKIYARGIRTMGATKWSWRIYLPGKPQFRLCISTNNPGGRVSESGRDDDGTRRASP